MKKYIAVKIVEAEECKAWQKSGDNEVGADGYKVKYEKDYISWCPKEVFEKHNRLCNGMTFGQAIEALKQGKRVARHGWNGKGMWLFLQDGFKMAKYESEYKNRYSEDVRQFLIEQEELEFLPKICMWTTNSHGRRAVLTGWLASQTDMLSEDWVIVE